MKLYKNLRGRPTGLGPHGNKLSISCDGSTTILELQTRNLHHLPNHWLIDLKIDLAIDSGNVLQNRLYWVLLSASTSTTENRLWRAFRFSFLAQRASILLTPMQSSSGSSTRSPSPAHNFASRSELAINVHKVVGERRRWPAVTVHRLVSSPDYPVSFRAPPATPGGAEQLQGKIYGKWVRECTHTEDIMDRATGCTEWGDGDWHLEQGEHMLIIIWGARDSALH